MGIKKSPTLLSWRTDSASNEHFKRGAQLRRLFLACAVRWLLTVVLVVATYGVLYVYSSKRAMENRKKKEFNALIIGLSIALGLNIASSLKHMVRELRWWVLSLYAWSPKEADLILQSENISRLLDLGVATRKHWIRGYVVVWVMINIAAQIAIATLGLTYNINSADKVTITAPGNVSVPDLTNIQTEKVLSTKSQALSALRYTANNYGLVALALGLGVPDDIPAPGTLTDPDNALVFCDSGTCQYIFYESTPPGLNYYMMVATDRSISATATCQSWMVLRGGGGDGRSIVIDDTNKSQINIPALNGASQTTYMVNPDQDSGPTWGHIRVFEASTTNPWFYDCNVTIGQVTNAKYDFQKVGTNVTSLAASAIALQGYGASSLGVNSSSTRSFQFQSYPAEVYYGAPQNGSTVDMAQTVASFAIGVVAVTAQANSNIEGPGRVPLNGIKLDITKWSYVHLILGLTVGLQAVFAVVSILIASRVTVRDHSYLSVAAMLAPLVTPLDHGGAMTSEKSILKQLGPNVTLTYVPAKNGIWCVKINNQDREMDNDERQKNSNGKD